MGARHLDRAPSALGLGIAGVSLLSSRWNFPCSETITLAGDIVLCVLVTFAALGIGALLAPATERHRNLLARVALR